MKYKEINHNDLFYLCSFLIALARYSKREVHEIINDIEDDIVENYYEYAGVFHCEQMAQVVYDFHTLSNWSLENTSNDNLKGNPTYWDIGKVFERLISDIYKIEKREERLAKVVREVFNSKVGKAIFDYENCLYWQPRACIYDCYQRDDFFYDMI